MTGFPIEELTYKHIIRLGIRQLKVERAIKLYQDGVGSLGYIADQLGMPKPELITEMRLRNIDPVFSDRTVQEELS